MPLKRLAAPKFWKIERKTKKFAIEPVPGPHSKGSCLPVGLVLRDVLHYANNTREIKTILKNGFVKIDGKIRKEKKFPLGLMDVLSVGDETYRLLPGRRGLTLKKIDKNESNIKPLRIEDKIYTKKGKIQLNLHDGTNTVIAKNNYKTGDVLIFDLDNRTIKNVIKFEKGARALIINGNNIGSVVLIEDVIITKSSMPNQAIVNDNGRKFTLPKSYLFVLGKGEYPIKVGG